MNDAELEELVRAEQAAQATLAKRREAREAHEKKKAAERLEPLKELAILAHDVLCSWNHTDGCGWGYEVDGKDHNWSAHAHYRYLERVDELVNGGQRGYQGQRVMPRTSPETLREILTMLAAIKAKHPEALWMLRHGLEPR